LTRDARKAEQARTHVKTVVARAEHDDWTRVAYAVERPPVQTPWWQTLEAKRTA
jgi:hypothetical protein